MGIPDGDTVLIKATWEFWPESGRSTSAVCCCPGCGLPIDVAEQVWPVAGSKVDIICEDAEGVFRSARRWMPFRPLRVSDRSGRTAKAVSRSMSNSPGHATDELVPTVRTSGDAHPASRALQDLFRLLNEGHLIGCVSAVATNTPAPSRAGVAYSRPIFITGRYQRDHNEHERPGAVRENLQQQATHPAADRLAATSHALGWPTIAVQDETSACYYAEANWGANRLIVCDSLPAAFEYADAQTEPRVDIILGAQTGVGIYGQAGSRDWSLLTCENGRPLFPPRPTMEWLWLRRVTASAGW